ncbi:hypothetical protein FOA43_003375 [Brettanomyces nanus]|uniref:Vacuolar protein sorting-associated protein 62 n=1 Tax=Eeniella nana TaxID=13502 RepID=A0A875S8I1_EENNA|nr:uncharacterized protein FOA43_003375 [Brettanomyces nanus]QPG75989.1 hypothetical protein FOA43_003375 [Brettanomyces nanus]
MVSIAAGPASLLSEEDEAHLSNVLRSATRFKNLPQLKSRPPPSERTLKDGEIPSYVTEYSPVVHLYSEERYLPYDIAGFVKHFHGEYENGTRINHIGKKGHLRIEDLEKLAPLSTKESKVYLTSNEDFDTDPEWLTGLANMPSYYNGEIKNAPATLIVVDKGNGWIDAYWFYFYSFNLGPFVMGFGPFGDHVGDWEHSLVRFYNGEPVIVWMSAHGGGGAYFYKNLEKWAGTKHPVIFSARGTHANYPSTGQHAHDTPYSILSDFTDRGPLWNPSLNYLAYTYDGVEVTYANGSRPFREAQYGNWLLYKGTWGDKKLVPEDPRQHWSPFEWKYLDGPAGPLTKNLERISPCQRHKWWNFWNGCNVRKYIKYGDGFFDKEGDNSCGSLYNMIRPGILKTTIETITWGGWFCWIMDLIFG